MEGAALGNIGQLEVYRTDWFKEVGVTKFPDNWEDLLAAGRLLKAKGHPFGFELGHGFGDNHGWLYPSCGRTAAARSTRTARPSSSTPTRRPGPSTSAAASTRRRCSKTSWAGPTSNNNKAFFGEQISCTNNASSILVVGQARFPEIAKVTDHGLNPQGPKGRSTCSTRSPTPS